MKKTLILGTLLLGFATFAAQAQSTASGNSNTGMPKAGSTPAQNGSVGSTVSDRKSTSGSVKSTPAGTMSESGSKTTGKKTKTMSKTSKMSSQTTSGR